jgi:NADH:ubiquinone reductase (H+-translocating)
LEANSLTFHNSNDVETFTQHLKNKFTKAKEFAKDSEEYKSHLSLVIGGGGLTGVEIAGELVHQIPKIAKEHGIPSKDISIYLVEAQAKLLMVLDKEVSESVTNFFEKQKDKIHLLTNSAIKEAKPGQIELTDGRIIKAETILWTGGIRANKFLETPYIDTEGKEGKFILNRGFRIEVDELYKVAGTSKTYAIGDNAYIIDPATKQPFPQNGQAAYKQGRAVARYIYAAIKSLKPKQKKITLDGLLVSLGPKLGSGMIINPATCYLPISLWARKIKKAIELRYRLFDIKR